MTANSLPPAGSICLSIHQHHHQTQQHQKNQLVPHDSTLFISESKHVVDVHLDSQTGESIHHEGVSQHSGCKCLKQRKWTCWVELVCKSIHYVLLAFCSNQPVRLQDPVLIPPVLTGSSCNFWTTCVDAQALGQALWERCGKVCLPQADADTLLQWH